MRYFVTDPSLGELELTGYEDRDVGFQPSASDLDQVVGVFSFTVVDVPQGLIPVLRDPELAHGFAVRLIDDDGVTVMHRGRIQEVELTVLTGMLAWTISAVDESVRILDTVVGSLDRGAVTSFDRDHVIAIMRDGFGNIATPQGTIDDAIYTANEAVGWSGIQATGLPVNGRDWSYLDVRGALDSLRQLVPNIAYRIRSSDLIFEWALVGSAEAPFAVGDHPYVDGVTVIEYENGSFREKWVMGDHRNKLRLGGFGTSESTAWDMASYARIGRVISARYVDDTMVPSADVERVSYARLNAVRRRRQWTFRIHDAGLVAGQVVPIIAGGAPPDWRAPWPDVALPVMARSDSGQLSAMRGLGIVQRVTTSMIGPVKRAYDVQAGDYLRDFPTVLADEEATA